MWWQVCIFWQWWGLGKCEQYCRNTSYVWLLTNTPALVFCVNWLSDVIRNRTRTDGLLWIYYHIFRYYHMTFTRPMRRHTLYIGLLGHTTFTKTSLIYPRHVHVHSYMDRIKTVMCILEDHNTTCPLPLFFNVVSALRLQYVILSYIYIYNGTRSHIHHDISCYL